MKSRPIAILGAGNMGSALALTLARHGRPVKLYCIEPDVEEEISNAHCNAKYLPGHPLPTNVSAIPDMVAAIENAEFVFVAVPSSAVRALMEKAVAHLAADAVVVNTAKGLDRKTLEPLALVEARLLPPRHRHRLCTIGGPAIATEMAKGSPTGMVVAGRDRTSVRKIQRLLATKTLKIASSRDLKGVSLAGALKNPYAIALGFCDGLKLPANAKALVFTLALAEMKQILEKAGAHPETATGLAGVGDLIVTGLSPHGRNRTYGERLVGAASKDPSKLGLTTVEGIASCKLANALARKLRVHVPLLGAVDRVLRARKDFAQPFVQYLNRIRLS